MHIYILLDFCSLPKFLQPWGGKWRRQASGGDGQAGSGRVLTHYSIPCALRAGQRWASTACTCFSSAHAAHECSLVADDIDVAYRWRMVRSMVAYRSGPGCGQPGAFPQGTSSPWLMRFTSNFTRGIISVCQREGNCYPPPTPRLSCHDVMYGILHLFTKASIPCASATMLALGAVF